MSCFSGHPWHSNFIGEGLIKLFVGVIKKYRMGICEELLYIIKMRDSVKAQTIIDLEYLKMCLEMISLNFKAHSLWSHLASNRKTNSSESILKVNLHFSLEIFASIHSQLLPTGDFFFIPLPKYKTNKFK